MIFVYVYLIVTLVFYIAISMIAMDRDEVKETLLISFLNIFYIFYKIFYKSLKHLSMNKAEKLLGHRFKLNSFSIEDKQRLGLSKGYGFKTYLHILLIKKKDFCK